MKNKNSRASRRCARKEHSLQLPKFLPRGKELTGSVGVQDTLVGAGAGLFGSLGLKWFVKRVGIDAQLPAFVNKFWPAVSGVTTGLILYGFQHRRSYARAKAHLIGASLAGLTLSAWDALKGHFPDLADLVSLQLSGYPGSYQGVIVDDYARGYQGVLVDDNAASQRNLEQLNAINMESSEYEEAA